MKSSPPKMGRVDASLGDSEARLRAPSRDGSALAESIPERAPYSPRETPTRPSLQAVRLAEEETRIAGGRDEVSQARRLDEAESGVVEAAARVVLPVDYDANDEHASDRSVEETARAIPYPSHREPFGEVDPYGGLILVDDEATPRSTASQEVSQVARRLEKQVPRLLVGMKDLSKFPIDPRGAFLIGYIDGFLSVEEIVDMCPMPASEALEADRSASHAGRDRARLVLRWPACDGLGFRRSRLSFWASRSSDAGIFRASRATTIDFRAPS